MMLCDGKNTEFRTFLLHTGPVALRGVLHSDLYDNFMHLSVALTILLSPKLCSEYCDYATQLLVVCVRNMLILYGGGMMVYNVPALIHWQMIWQATSSSARTRLRSAQRWFRHEMERLERNLATANSTIGRGRPL